MLFDLIGLDDSGVGLLGEMQRVATGLGAGAA